jgi:hypothetical protein
MISSRAKAVACGTLTLLLSALPLGRAQAQTETKPFVNAYMPDYFASSHPSSAFEMVGLLPSFQLVEGDTKVRGYGGSIGNVMIDGRPPTSKQETLETVLRRITPDSVERIEIVRSGAAGFDFQGYPMLANVVLKPNSAPRGQVTLQGSFLRHGNSNKVGTARMTWGTTDVLDLTFTGSRKVPDAGAGYGYRNNVAPNGADVRRDRYYIKRNDDVWNLTGGYRQPLFGGTVRLNGLYNELRSSSPLLDSEYFPVVSIQPGGETEFRTDSEFGLQYNHAIFTASELESTLIRRAENDHHPQLAITPTETDVSSTTARTSETIMHNVFRSQDSSLSFEGGLDLTLNTLVNLVALTKNGVNIPLPAADVHIQEQRGEGFSTLTWQAAPELTIESGLRYEMSRMKQTGDSVLTRQFSYLKPRVKASYKLDKDDVLRLLVEREAGQLNFNNFVTTIEIKVNSVNAGNKNLIPQTLWRAEVDWERALPGGSLVLAARHEMISNTMDHIAIRGVAGDLDSLGNIGTGRNTEFQANLIYPVAWPPLSGLTIQANALYRFSEVTDPNTHVRRSISQSLPWDAKIALTQDLPDWQTRLGASYAWPKGQNVWRYNEYQLMHSKDPVTELFAEYKPAPEWLIRLFGRNVTDQYNQRDRHIFFGNRGSTLENYEEYRRLTYGPEVGLYLQRSFGR